MKKVLVALLAVAMMLTFVPFAFAEGECEACQTAACNECGLADYICEDCDCAICAAPIAPPVACEKCQVEGCDCANAPCTCDGCACEAEEEDDYPYAFIPECLRPLFDYLAPYIGEKVADLIFVLVLQVLLEVVTGISF